VVTRGRITECLRNTRPAANAECDARAKLPSALAREIFSQPLVPAAVLVPLVERDANLMLLLTRRTAQLRVHPGQISFPGGRVDAEDVGALECALRETHEELGVSAELIAVAGYLPTQPVITGYAVTPVVGFMSGNVSLRPDPREVAEVLEIPLAFFLEPGSARHASRQLGEITVPVIEYWYESRRIWGATAAIIQSLARIIG